MGGQMDRGQASCTRLGSSGTCCGRVIGKCVHVGQFGGAFVVGGPREAISDWLQRQWPEAVSAFPAEQGNHASADGAAGAMDLHAVRVEMQEHSCFVNGFDEPRKPEDESCGANISAPSTPRASAKTFQRTPCRQKASLKMESPMKITAENLWSYEPLSFNPLSGVAFSPYISLNAWN